MHVYIFACFAFRLFPFLGDVLAGNLGRSIIFTTHYLEEADVLADRKAVLARGKVQAREPSQRHDKIELVLKTIEHQNLGLERLRMMIFRQHVASNASFLYVLHYSSWTTYSIFLHHFSIFFNSCWYFLTAPVFAAWGLWHLSGSETAVRFGLSAADPAGPASFHPGGRLGGWEAGTLGRRPRGTTERWIE